MPDTATPPARRPRTLGDHTWQDHAACRSTEYHTVDPELFFPQPDDLDTIAAAKALCAQCTVRDTCLDAALENLDRHGIRGGLTEEERRARHATFQRRLDRARVDAVLAGRDVYLTEREREAVALAAYRQGMPARNLARLLKVSREHAEKLYRRTRRRLRDRTLTTTGPQQKKQAVRSRANLGEAA
ncbi:WhiB family transcriptional regulator [Streptomyces sp. B1866]|uniref:WhiB family transcriptional regulator n=1 Tax=Streptomyces sp. B1866 TaxID=3075431 RepID=UPI00288C89DE|nr:WhiB family transcriptional regulator [Streptomyces sp. B1866]MDT3395282.1 WhiB family transcriptional regulator [Streptomyces sp. B1866]